MRRLLEEPIVEPQVPMTYDLSGDPQQIWNLTATKQDNAWMLVPVYRERRV